MINKRAGLPFLVLGFVALAGGIACLGWAKSLGGFNFVGATGGIFLAMVSFSRFVALRRQAQAARSVLMAAPTTRDSLHAPLTGGRRAIQQDAELAARLAALRAPRPSPEAEPSAWADLEPDPEAAFEVIEGPPADPAMEVTEGPPDLAPAEAAPAEPVAPVALVAQVAPVAPVPYREPGGLRQMDELRAEIARLREGSRRRQVVGAGGRNLPAHAESEAAAATQRASRDAFARTEFSDLPGGAAEPSEGTDAFQRTEFSGIDEQPERPSFTKTEFLGPV